MTDLDIYLHGLRESSCGRKPRGKGLRDGKGPHRRGRDMDEDLLSEMDYRIPKAQWMFTIPIPGVDIDLHIAPESAISRYRTYVVGIAQHGKEPAGWYVYSYENQGDRDWKPSPDARMNKVKGEPGSVPRQVVDLVQKWLAKQIPDKGYRKDFKSYKKL